MIGNTMEKTMKTIAEKVAQQTESVILEQIEELVKRGLLVVEREPLSIYQVRDQATGEVKFNIGGKIRLVLKDQEYIEKLEKQVKEYSELFATIKNGIK